MDGWNQRRDGGGVARAVADVNTQRDQRTDDAADASTAGLERGQWREREDAAMPLRHCRCRWGGFRFLLRSRARFKAGLNLVMENCQ